MFINKIISIKVYIGKQRVLIRKVMECLNVYDTLYTLEKRNVYVHRMEMFLYDGE
jgi:hypothetical protein